MSLQVNCAVLVDGIIVSVDEDFVVVNFPIVVMIVVVAGHI
jgi:hypothetical protein